MPAYVKGVPRRIVIQTSNSASKASTPSSSSDLTSCIRTRRNRSSSSNSSGDHSSTETGSTKPEVNRMATRSRTSTTSVVTSVVTPSGAVRRRRQSSSSSSSSSSGRFSVDIYKFYILCPCLREARKFTMLQIGTKVQKFICEIHLKARKIWRDF